MPFTRTIVNPFTQERIEVFNFAAMTGGKGAAEQAGVALVPDPTSAGRSHFLGGPLLKPGTEWPSGPNGPLAFLLCVDFSELDTRHAEAIGLPKSGVLNVFYDTEGAAWFLGADGPSHWRVVYETEQPEQLSTPPETPQSIGIAFANDHSEPGSGKPRHRLGGVPNWVQDDLRAQLHLASGHYMGNRAVLEAIRSAGLPPDALRTADHGELLRIGHTLNETGANPDIFKEGIDEWRLLLQIDTDPELSFCWGDLGTLYVMIPQPSMARHRFDDAWVCMQCF